VGDFVGTVVVFLICWGIVNLLMKFLRMVFGSLGAIKITRGK